MSTPLGAAASVSRASANPTSHTNAGLPRKVLAGLGVAVLLAHALVVQVVGNAMDAPTRLVTRPFTTRAVAVSVAETPPNAAAAPSPSTAPAVLPARPPAPRPIKRPAVRPESRPAASLDAPPAPNAAPESTPAVAVAENVPPATEPDAAKPPEVVAAQPEPAASAPQVATAVAPGAAAATSTPAPAASPPAAAVAYTVPGSVRLLYNTVALVDRLNWSLKGEFLWLQDGSSYDARLQWSAPLIGSKVFTSTGRIGSEGLLPTRFSDKFRSSEVAAHFVRDKQMVVFSANTPQVPLVAGMQDQLSVFVQVSAMLGGAPAKFPPGTELTFVTIGARSPDTWVFVINGEEKLSLPGGEIATLKLSRGARREFDQTAELWLAPSLGYLPVRIKISERNGDFIDQQWRASETP